MTNSVYPTWWGTYVLMGLIILAGIMPSICRILERRDYEKYKNKAKQKPDKE